MVKFSANMLCVSGGALGKGCTLHEDGIHLARTLSNAGIISKFFLTCCSAVRAAFICERPSMPKNFVVIISSVIYDSGDERN